ncbi:MAG: hypothetical protein JNJ46_21360 [Myxococcales bacterium]|nr:hypothetical protein [Myxococcales bacterium]
MPTAAHVIYIPAMLMFGILIGYFLGTRAARDALAAEQARREAKAARRAARHAEHVAAASEITTKSGGNDAQDSSQ